MVELTMVLFILYVHAQAIQTQVRSQLEYTCSQVLPKLHSLSRLIDELTIQNQDSCSITELRKIITKLHEQLGKTGNDSTKDSSRARNFKLQNTEVGRQTLCAPSPEKRQTRKNSYTPYWYVRNNLLNEYNLIIPNNLNNTLARSISSWLNHYISSYYSSAQLRSSFVGG